jgi:hypothetical protein
MIIKQVSVFLENKLGRLNEVTHILGDAGINISAFTIADTSDFGILRLIVSDPAAAKKILKQNQFSVQTTDVVLVKTTNKPGSLAKLLEVLNSEDVFIEYMYSFSKDNDAAINVIRPVDIQKCMNVLQKQKDKLLFTDEL